MLIHVINCLDINQISQVIIYRGYFLKLIQLYFKLIVNSNHYELSIFWIYSVIHPHSFKFQL